MPMKGNAIQTQVAIVDYGLGNLFSVKHACEFAGLQAAVTSTRDLILAADAVILPGVGAFGDAMGALERLDLVGPLRDVASSGKPLVGICLGMQLLMTESYEFGLHKGLGLARGPVVHFDNPMEGGKRCKVPQVGWNRIYRRTDASRETPEATSGQDPWGASLLRGLADGEFMYFVHSFYCRPEDRDVVLSFSQYGHVEFCSSLKMGNVYGFQFHPERSGPRGLEIYSNLAAAITRRRNDKED
ncbi:MAG: imidazole glycerol phosphate synthase subunit HisH [Verrucomicrobiota bacterium]